ncbi:MAG: beta propeller repeat protein, partial [Planctomycetota bacterium]
RWVSSLEASRHERERVYVTLDGHRSNDDAPYAFVSEDAGRTWRSLTDNLPAGVGSTRVLREDRENANLLYLGTEFGLYVSLDRGTNWTRFHGNLPTVAIHEVAQHPSGGDVVVATHGRSLWAIDVSPLRQIDAETLAADGALFAPSTRNYWRSTPRRGTTIRRFIGKNPADGAEIYYAVGANARSASLEILDSAGATLRTLDANTGKGLHRTVWDMRRQPPQQSSGQQGNRRFRRSGPRVEPGTYMARLTVDGSEYTASFTIAGDPDHPEAVLWGESYDEWLEMNELLESGGEEDE